MVDLYATTVGPSPYAPASPLGIAVPLAAVAPAPLPSPGYQGLLDRLHLAGQTAAPVLAAPIAPPLAAAPVTRSFQPIPVLSGLYEQLKLLLNQFLSAPSTPAPPGTPPATTPPSSPKQTAFVISSFNVLGSSHTKGPGSDRPGMAPGITRIRSAVDLLERHDVDVVGFQEFQHDQFTEFQKVAGDTFAVYPGFKLGKPEVVNSIAWRKDTWDLVKADPIDIPYFDGKPRKMPVIRLRHKKTGQEAYFANFHNPASTRKQGDHEQWRDVATQKEIALVNRLRKETGLPVFVTGDMNERDEYFRKMTQQTDMVSADPRANGRAPAKMAIDWIFGTESQVTFSDYTRDRSLLVQKTTDHPMVVSTATITRDPKG